MTAHAMMAGMATQAERQKAYRARLRGGPPRELLPCGTSAAIRRHRRAGEPLCDECRAEAARMAREYRQSVKA